MNTLPESHRRPLFPRGPGLGLRAALLALISLALIFNDTRGDGLQGVRQTLSFMLAPLVWVAALPDHLRSAAENLDTRETLERENRELREKQLWLEVRLQKLAALEAENRRIRELLASAARIEDEVLIAEIVAINQDPYRSQITLNKGSRDAVYRGQAVVDAGGVLGQIVDVGHRRSRALLITDPNHGIPVEVNRTGMQTIAIGAGELGLRLPFLASNADIKVGDLLVSSALGGRFPAGYPVGTVYEVKHVAGEHFMEAYASPAARLNQGRQALLVWSDSYPLGDGDTLDAPPPTDATGDGDEGALP
ncbi:rod shape-determining protein MreC [Sinimarinibacterium thermocellulolyticum]|uniref:Cell shape-determining protein MreC n=1 Tax=Sinimarinibacterium thermocellulolyticum TaxID=3170016 RepID=A0ABV2A726_9GAMM